MSRTAAPVLTRAGLGLAAALALALPASAQRLWSVEEVTTRPLPPIEVGGVAAVPQASGLAGPLTAEAAAVQVEFDYLRLGMGYLELPLMDGSVIEAENAVFEDRGDGNLMWTGEVPGAGYESVVFTVQDGHLVGWFGEPGGPKYSVYAGPGRPRVAVRRGGSYGRLVRLPRRRKKPSWEAVLGSTGGHSQGPHGSVISASNDSSLDILVLYPAGTERHWRTIGGPGCRPPTACRLPEHGVSQRGDFGDGEPDPRALGPSDLRSSRNSRMALRGSASRRQSLALRVSCRCRSGPFAQALRA